jgi:hypothetical protein
MSCPSCSEAHHCAGQLKVTTSGRSPVVPVVQVNEVNVSAATEPCSASSACRSFRHCTDCCQCPEGNLNAILLNMLKKHEKTGNMHVKILQKRYESWDNVNTYKYLTRGVSSATCPPLEQLLIAAFQPIISICCPLATENQHNQPLEFYV